MEKQMVLNFTQNLNIDLVFRDVADYVGSTLGPYGKYVIWGDGENVFTTKDGVTCLKQASAKDPFVKNLIEVIKESAENTLKKAGDGTTSTIVLSYAMYKSMKTKADELELKNKIDEMVNSIDKIAKKVEGEEDIKKIVNTSLSGDSELTELVAQAVLQSNKATNIVVNIDDNLDKSNVEVIDGVTLAGALISEAFASQEEITFERPLVVLYAGAIELEREVIKFIDMAISNGYKEIVLIANNYTEEAVSALAINHVQNVVKILPVQVSGGGKLIDSDIVSILKDATNLPIAGQKMSLYLHDIDISNYLPPKKVVYRNGILTIEGLETPVTKDGLDKLKKYKTKLEKAKDDEESLFYSFLISLLERKLVRINIGGAVKNKKLEIKDRIDDALHSIRSALNKGYVHGGGKAYIELNKITKNPNKYEKVFDAIYRKIIENAGFEFDVSKAYDSALAVKYVLLSAYELAALLRNVSYITYVEPPKNSIF